MDSGSVVRTRKLVVAGLITNAAGKVLITRRMPHQPMPNQWEFPGGKMEPGESPQAALVRELEEELDAEVVVGPVWDVLFHPYPGFDLLMLVYHCRFAPDTQPRPREVAELAWCLPCEVENYDVLPADEPLVQRLARDGLPVWRV